MAILFVAAAGFFYTEKMTHPRALLVIMMCCALSLHPLPSSPCSSRTLLCCHCLQCGQRRTYGMRRARLSMPLHVIQERWLQLDVQSGRHCCICFWWAQAKWGHRRNVPKTNKNVLMLQLGWEPVYCLGVEGQLYVAIRWLCGGKEEQDQLLRRKKGTLCQPLQISDVRCDQ